MFRSALAVAALFPILALGCRGEDQDSDVASPRVMRVALGNEPTSLDPALAYESASANILFNTSDPLVKLDEDFEAVPNLAASWEWSPDGTTITFHLRKDGRWTNGDPLTAHDYEWSWKRLLSSELGSEYAYLLYGIVGAQAYYECANACETLRDEVGIEAVDDFTLRVRLTSPQPWFPQQIVHWVFLPAHRPTVERFGSAWTDPKNLVTSGPFKLLSWTHDESVVLIEDPEWREARDVALDRVVLPIIAEPGRQVEAFRRGEVDATIETPPEPEDVESLTASGDLAIYPIIGTRYYGFNVENVSDVDQRRAMALAVDRPAQIEAGGVPEVPATGLIPPGMPGFDTITGDLLQPDVELEKARAYMRRAVHPKRTVTLYVNDAPDVKRTTALAREAWAKLGIETRIKVLEWGQFLEAMGPPPDKAVDVVQIGWLGDYVDPSTFFELVRCGSANNWWNFCDKPYDRLLNEARRTPDNNARYQIYAQLEARLTGRNGLMPVAPIHWFLFLGLEKPSVRETFNVNPLAIFDLARVRIEP